MTEKVVGLINEFEHLVNSVPSHVAAVTCVAPHAYKLSPKGWEGQPWEGKAVALTILGITHGTEIAGLEILNEFLRSIKKSVLKLEVPVVLALGNVEAAKQGLRYLESDLNRSFMRATLETTEHHRARELEQVIASSRYLLDLHQTRLPSEEPFFIFPYSPGGFEFAQMICDSTPIVTHWGRPFSKDGRCTDEFCNAQGGSGISVELGQNGLHPYRVAAGFKLVMHALEAVTLAYRGDPVKPAQTNPLYTWSEIVDFPQSGKASLKPGFVNFSAVAKGETLGEIDDKSLVANHDGRILFPYYPSASVKNAPAELCRIMKTITREDLPV